MTYILVHDEKGNQAVGTLYNQWNHGRMQAYKIIRFEKQLAKWKKNKIRFPHDYSDWVKMYTHLASISDTSMENNFREYMHYNNCAGMYSEDNNDGWQFIIIKVDDDYKPVKVTYGFKLNKYRTDKNGHFKLVKGFVNLYDNIMYSDKGTKEEYQIKKIENYLKKFTKTDQKIMEKINNSFDEKIIKFAEQKIKMHIDKKRNEKRIS